MYCGYLRELTATVYYCKQVVPISVFSRDLQQAISSDAIGAGDRVAIAYEDTWYPGGLMMTDYKEEQHNEIEALESIYPDELQVLSTDPFYSFTIDLRTDEVKDEPLVSVTLKFAYVPNYPDEPPLIEIAESENLDDDDASALLQFLSEKAEEYLGMVMVFTLVSEVSEWLSQRVHASLTKRKEDEEIRLKNLEEEERQKFEGTRVTVETFMSWKAKFDREMAELKKQNCKESTTKRATGRELFEKDVSLIDSDLQFFQEGDEEVKVDESLFQEFDDLELEDDLDDEESS